MTLNTNNIINLLSHPLSLSEYVWIVHSTLVTIATYTTDGSDYIYLCACIFVHIRWTESIHVGRTERSMYMTWISNIICHGLYFVQWVRGDCSFHWYWWNCWCWSSLIKLSFHKHLPTSTYSIQKKKDRSMRMFAFRKYSASTVFLGFYSSFVQYSHLSRLDPLGILLLSTLRLFVFTFLT